MHKLASDLLFLLKKYSNQLDHTLESGIGVGPTVINLAFFPGPTALLKAQRLLFFGIFLGPTANTVCKFHLVSFFFQHSNFFKYEFFSHISFHIDCRNSYEMNRGLNLFCHIFPALRLFFFPNFPSPTFIQGPMFIIVAKSSRLYAYSLPYVYCGL